MGYPTQNMNSPQSKGGQSSPFSTYPSGNPDPDNLMSRTDMRTEGGYGAALPPPESPFASPIDGIGGMSDATPAPRNIDDALNRAPVPYLPSPVNNQPKPPNPFLNLVNNQPRPRPDYLTQPVTQPLQKGQLNEFIRGSLSDDSSVRPPSGLRGPGGYPPINNIFDQQRNMFNQRNRMPYLGGLGGFPRGPYMGGNPFAGNGYNMTRDYGSPFFGRQRGVYGQRPPPYMLDGPGGGFPNPYRPRPSNPFFDRRGGNMGSPTYLTNPNYPRNEIGRPPYELNLDEFQRGNNNSLKGGLASLFNSQKRGK